MLYLLKEATVDDVISLYAYKASDNSWSAAFNFESEEGDLYPTIPSGIVLEGIQEADFSNTASIAIGSLSDEERAAVVNFYVLNDNDFLTENGDAKICYKLGTSGGIVHFDFTLIQDLDDLSYSCSLSINSVTVNTPIKENVLVRYYARVRWYESSVQHAGFYTFRYPWPCDLPSDASLFDITDSEDRDADLLDYGVEEAELAWFFQIILSEKPTTYAIELYARVWPLDPVSREIVDYGCLSSFFFQEATISGNIGNSSAPETKKAFCRIAPGVGYEEILPDKGSIYTNATAGTQLYKVVVPIHEPVIAEIEVPAPLTVSTSTTPITPAS